MGHGDDIYSISSDLESGGYAKKNKKQNTSNIKKGNLKNIKYL